MLMNASDISYVINTHAAEDQCGLNAILLENDKSCESAPNLC